MSKPQADDGGLAFARPAVEIDGEWRFGQKGLTVRDYFAAAALPAIIQRFENLGAKTQATHAYEVADAMLAERKKYGGY